MNRRALIICALTAAVVSGAAGQPSGKTRRLAIFSPSESAALMKADSANRYYRALFDELRRLGYVEGQNLVVERYGRERSAGDAGALATEVIRSNPDVVYVVGPGALLFKAPKATLPVVALSGDPVAAGLASSLVHPGGNITGVSVDTGPSLYGKRIELLRDLRPGIAKIAYLGLRVAWEGLVAAPLRAACDTAGLSLVPSLLELPSTDADYRLAMAAVLREAVDAIIVEANPDTVANRDTIVGLIAEARLPAMYALPEFVEIGGLIAYAFDLVELNRQAARDIDAILRGTRPGDIPYYQASRFKLTVNLKTARALGLTVPANLLAEADEVIE